MWGLIHRQEGLIVCGSPVWGFYPSCSSIRRFGLACHSGPCDLGQKAGHVSVACCSLVFQGLSACEFLRCSCSPVFPSSVLYFSRMYNYYLWESYSGISYSHSPSKALHSFYTPSDFYLKIIGAYLHLLIRFTRFFVFASFLPLLPPG